MPLFGAANPFVRVVLESPLHRLMSGALVVLEVQGRKSGQRFRFPVMYARSANEVVVVAAWASKKRWWKNLVDRGEIGLRLAGVERRAEAEVIPDGPERGRLLRIYLARFPSAAKGIGLPGGADRSGSDAELSAALGDAQVVRIRLRD